MSEPNPAADSAAIAKRAPSPSAAVLPFEVGSYNDLWGIAQRLAKSGLLPDALRNQPENTFVILITGHELGLSPMQAIRGIDVIKGKPFTTSDLAVALVRRSGLAKSLRMEFSDRTRARFVVHRHGEPTPEAYELKLSDVPNHLIKKDNWRDYPDVMLRRRVRLNACREVFPDVVGGIYDYDEVTEAANDAGGRYSAFEAAEAQVVAEQTNAAPAADANQGDDINLDDVEVE